MNNKWLTKLIIFVFLLSTFSNSALVVTPAFAETGGDEETSEALVYEDGEYDVPVEFLHASEDETSTMQSYLKGDTAKVIIENSEINAFVTFDSGNMIEELKVELNGILKDVNIEDVDEKENTKTFSFKVEDLNSLLNGEVFVDAGFYKKAHQIRIAFDASKIPHEGEKFEDGKNESNGNNNEKSNEEKDKDDSNENSSEGNKGSDGSNNAEGEEDNSGNNSGNVKPEENPEEKTEEKPFLEDGVYGFAYKSEGVNLGSYYKDKAIVVVKDGQQYLQLQGKGMRDSVEYLYIDGKGMDVSAPTSEKGAYIAQIPLEESVDKKNTFTFTMVINAMGRIMNHAGTVKLDLMSKEKLEDDAFELIEGIPAKENEDFQDHKNVYSYEYDSGGMDLSRYYEGTIDVLDKNGKTYLEFKGTGMSTFIQALYVDGKKMAIKENGDGSYIAQIEHKKELDEAFTFDMIINAMGRVMAHKTEVKLLVPSDVKTITYTTKGANISRSYEPEAFLLERDGEQYIQLQGKSMREYIEYLYIDGKKIDISRALDGEGAYLAQFKLDKPLSEKNTFKFDMVINARGMLMNHQTEITFNEDSIKDADKIAHTIVNDTTQKNDTTINEHNDIPTVSYETVGANISGNYEDFISIIKNDGKQYLQLHGKSGHQFVDALFIDGERMSIGEPEKDGSYLAQYELAESLKEKNTFDFTMLINTPQGLMTHKTKIIITQDGEYSIDFEALYQDKEETSTAGAYLVSPTKLVVDGNEKQLFIKLKDHETITDFKIKQDDKYVSPEIVSTNEKANTRIVAFDIDSLTDVIDAQVKVKIPGNYSSEQPFRIKLDPESLTEYDGALEKDEEKPEELKDGKYTINFRTLDLEGFEKVAIGKHLNPPANIELKDGKKIVTLKINDDVKKFQIKNGYKFVEPKVVGEDKENKTRNVEFEISDLDEIVIAKLTIASEKQRAGTTEHDVRLYFEGNSITPVDVDEDTEEDPVEKADLVAEKASKVEYQILKDENDEKSSANGFFSGKAVILEYEGTKYAQITTANKGAQYIEWLKNEIDGNFEDMVIVEEVDGERTYQFKLTGDLSEEVVLNMFIDAGMYAQEHDARLVFDASTEKEADPKAYVLLASTNANGPDGDNAQTPGEPSEPTDPKDPEKPEDPEDPKDNGDTGNGQTPGAVDELEFDSYTINYQILQDTKDKPSVANDYFTGKATLIEPVKSKDKYVQITTKGDSGKYIKELKNKLGNTYQDMLVVKNKNGEKTYQFKLSNQLHVPVLLKMFIEVPGVYKQEHDARLVFDTASLQELKGKDGKKVKLYQDKDGIQGPKDAGEPVNLGGGTSSGKGKGQGSGSDGQGTTKEEGTSIKPEKAFAINYVIKQENADEVSIANDYFTGQAVLLEKGKDKYAHITTKDGSAKFIDALRSQLNGKFVDMAIVAKDGDDITYQFKLDGAVSEATLLDMIITVPGIYENQDHKARLFFDESSMEEIDPAGHEIVGLGKPSFGEGSNGGSSKKSGQETNPQTNDVTMIVFYSLLLVGAGLVLFFQFRRKFAKQ